MRPEGGGLEKVAPRRPVEQRIAANLRALLAANAWWNHRAAYVPEGFEIDSRGREDGDLVGLLGQPATETGEVRFGAAQGRGVSLGEVCDSHVGIPAKSCIVPTTPTSRSERPGRAA
jgi:hypothetical protein